jgi:hypothetical protein
MGRDKKWTNELKGELVKFFEEAEKAGSKSVLKNSEEFAKKYDNLTPSQVKTAYYKFYEISQQANNKEIANRWSNQENEELLNAIDSRNGTLAEIFEKHAQKYNRTHNNVSQHYYFLLRQMKKNNNKSNNNNKKTNQEQRRSTQNTWTKKTKVEEIEKLTRMIKRLPMDKIESLQNIVSGINKKA